MRATGFVFRVLVGISVVSGPAAAAADGCDVDALSRAMEATTAASFGMSHQTASKEEILAGIEKFENSQEQRATFVRNFQTKFPQCSDAESLQVMDAAFDGIRRELQ